MKIFFKSVLFVSILFISFTAEARNWLESGICEHHDLSPSFSDDETYFFNPENVSKLTYRALNNKQIEFEQVFTYKDGLLVNSSSYASNSPSYEHVYFYKDGRLIKSKESIVYKNKKSEVLSVNSYDYDDGGNLYRIITDVAKSQHTKKSYKTYDYVSRKKLDDGTFEEVCMKSTESNPDIDIYKISSDGLLLADYNVYTSSEVKQALNSGDEQRIYGIRQALQDMELPSFATQIKLGGISPTFYEKMATEGGFKLSKISKLGVGSSLVHNVSWYSKYYDLIESIDPIASTKDELEKTRKIIDIKYDNKGNWVSKTFYTMKFSGMDKSTPYVSEPTGRVFERDIEYK